MFRSRTPWYTCETLFRRLHNLSRLRCPLSPHKAEIADLSRSYSLAESRASEALTISNVKLDTALAALDDCRAALAERSRELCKHHEARAARGESCTAARVAAAADVIRSAEALATALQESQELRGRLLEEESLRRRANAELDEVMLRCKEEVAKRVATEATAGAASEEAKARYETDLAVADDERCMLEEERKLLQDRINVMEVCIHLVGFILVNSTGMYLGMCRKNIRRALPLHAEFLSANKYRGCTSSGGEASFSLTEIVEKRGTFKTERPRWRAELPGSRHCR